MYWPIAEVPECRNEPDEDDAGGGRPFGRPERSAPIDRPRRHRSTPRESPESKRGRLGELDESQH